MQRSTTGRANVTQLFGAETISNLRWQARRLASAGLDADDLLHDALERALRGIERFEPGSNLCAWICTIMHNLVVDHCRHLQIQRSPAWRLNVLIAQSTHAQQEICPYRPANEIVSSEKEHAPAPSMTDIHAAAARLPAQLQTAFRMHAFEGRRYREIARVLDVPVSTVGTRIWRARALLRRVLRKKGFTDPAAA